MDDWENFNETSLPEKDDFYIHLDMEDITDAEHKQAKAVYKDFKIKSSGEYYHLYFQSYTLIVS